MPNKFTKSKFSKYIIIVFIVITLSTSLLFFDLNIVRDLLRLELNKIKEQNGTIDTLLKNINNEFITKVETKIKESIDFFVKTYKGWKNQEDASQLTETTAIANYFSEQIKELSTLLKEKEIKKLVKNYSKSEENPKKIAQEIQKRFAPGYELPQDMQPEPDIAQKDDESTTEEYIPVAPV